MVIEGIKGRYYLREEEKDKYPEEWKRQQERKRAYNNKPTVYVRRRQQAEDWKKNNRDRYRLTQNAAHRRYTLRRFGLTEEDYNTLWHSQGCCCGICKTKENPTKKDWSVDHCHSSGRVRGILCKDCNIMLGLAKDSVAVLKAAIVYLEKHNE